MGVKTPGQVRKESVPSSSLAAPLKARLFNFDNNDATLKKEHQDVLEQKVVPL